MEVISERLVRTGSRHITSINVRFVQRNQVNYRLFKLRSIGLALSWDHKLRKPQLSLAQTCHVILGPGPHVPRTCGHHFSLIQT